MDGESSFLTCCDGVDSELRSGVNVSANEDVRLSSLVCERISDCAVSSSQLYLGALEQVSPKDALTY